MTTRPSHPARRDARGMTFLEVVAATALLSIVAAAIFGVFGFVAGSQSRDQNKLGAAEVANRLMLAYLDDPTHMPNPSKTVEYGPLQYRWDYVEQPLTVTEINADQRDTTRSSPLSPDRFLQVTVRAWLSENSGGSRFPDGSTPMVRLTRMLDPAAPRNPDSFMNMIQDPSNFQRLMETMMGFQGGGLQVNGNVNINQQGRGGQRGQGQNGNPQFRTRGGGQFGAQQAFQRGRGFGGGGGGFQGLFGPRGFNRGGGGGPGGGQDSGATR